MYGSSNIYGHPKDLMCDLYLCGHQGHVQQS